MNSTINATILQSIMTEYGFSSSDNDECYEATIQGISTGLEYYADGAYPNLLYTLDSNGDVEAKLEWAKLSQLLNYLESFDLYFVGT